MANTAYEVAVLASSPSLYWPLNEGNGSGTVADLSGNNLVGTVGSSCVLGSGGLVASDQRTSVAIPSGSTSVATFIYSANSALIQPSAAVSLEFVVTMASVGTLTYLVSVGQPTNGSECAYAVYINATGKISIEINSAGLCTSSFALAVGVPYHIGFTFNGITASLYINGVLNVSYSFGTTTAITQYGYGLAVGNNVTTPYPGTNARFQDVAIYNYALSSSLIAAHAKIAAGYVNSAYEQAVMRSTPALYWPLGDLAGSATAIDYSGNGLNGTVGSAVILGSTALVSDKDPTTSALCTGGAEASTKQISRGPSALLQPAKTISFEWLGKLTALPTTNTQWISYGEVPATSYCAYGAYLTPAGTLVLDLNTSIRGISTALTVGVTYHFACTYDGTTASIYINGVLNVATSYSATLTGSYGSYGIVVGNPCTIGGQNAIACYTNNVAIYTSVLSAATILQHSLIAFNTSNAVTTSDTLPAKSDTPLALLTQHILVADSRIAVSDTPTVTDIPYVYVDNVNGVETRAVFNDLVSCIRTGYLYPIDNRSVFSDSPAVADYETWVVAWTDVRASVSDLPLISRTGHATAADTRATFSDVIWLTHTIFPIDTKPSIADAAILVFQHTLAVNDVRSGFSDSVTIIQGRYLTATDTRAAFSDSNHAVVRFGNDYVTAIDTRIVFTDIASVIDTTYVAAVDMASPYSDAISFTITGNVIATDTRVFSDIITILQGRNSVLNVTDTSSVRTDSPTVLDGQIQFVTPSDTNSPTSNSPVILKTQYIVVADVRSTFSDLGSVSEVRYAIATDLRAGFTDFPSRVLSIVISDTNSGGDDEPLVFKSYTATDIRATFSDSAFLPDPIRNLVPIDTRTTTDDSYVNLQDQHHTFAIDIRTFFSDQPALNFVRGVNATDTGLASADVANVHTIQAIPIDTRIAFIDYIVIAVAHFLTPSEPGMNVTDNVYITDAHVYFPIDTRSVFSDAPLILPMLHPMSVTDTSASRTDGGVISDSRLLIVSDTGSVSSDSPRVYNATFRAADTRPAFSDDSTKPVQNVSFLEVQRAYGFTDGLTGTVAVTLPVPPTVGNQLVAFSVGTLNTIAPSGWTLVASVQGAIVEGSTYANAVAFEHKVVAGDTTLTNFNTTPIGLGTPGGRYPTCVVVLEYQYADSAVTFSPSAACTFSAGLVSGVSAAIQIPDSSVVALFPLYVPDFATYTPGNESIDSGFTLDLAQYSNEAGFGNNMFLVGHINHLATNQTITPTASFPNASLYTNPQQSAFLLVVAPFYYTFYATDTRAVFNDLIEQIIPMALLVTDTRAVFADSVPTLMPKLAASDDIRAGTSEVVVFRSMPHILTAIDTLPAISEILTCINGILFTDLVDVEDDSAGTSDLVLLSITRQYSVADTRVAFNDQIGLVYLFVTDTRAVFRDSLNLDYIYLTSTRATFTDSLKTLTMYHRLIVTDDYVGSFFDFPMVSDINAVSDTRPAVTDSVLMYFVDNLAPTDNRHIISDNPTSLLTRYLFPEDDFGEYGADFPLFTIYPAYIVNDYRGSLVSDVPILLLSYTVYALDTKPSISDNATNVVFKVPVHFVTDIFPSKTDLANIFIVPPDYVIDTRVGFDDEDGVQFTLSRTPFVNSDNRIPFSDTANLFHSFLTPQYVYEARSQFNDIGIVDLIKFVNLSELRTRTDKLSLAGVKIDIIQFINVTDGLVRHF